MGEGIRKRVSRGLRTPHPEINNKQDPMCGSCHKMGSLCNTAANLQGPLERDQNSENPPRGLLLEKCSVGATVTGLCVASSVRLAECKPMLAPDKL